MASSNVVTNVATLQTAVIEAFRGLSCSETQAVKFGYSAYVAANVLNKIETYAATKTEVDSLEEGINYGVYSDKAVKYLRPEAEAKDAATYQELVDTVSKACGRISIGIHSKGNTIAIGKPRGGIPFFALNTGENSLASKMTCTYSKVVLHQVHVDTLNEVKATDFAALSEAEVVESVNLISDYLTRAVKFSGDYNGIVLEVEAADELLTALPKPLAKAA